MIPSVDELIEKYVMIRDQLTEDRKEFKTKETVANGQMYMIETQLRDIAQILNVSKFGSKHGTAYSTIKTSYRVENWEETLQFIKDTGNWQMLEKRVAKRATEEIYDSEDVEIPGINAIKELTFVVRRTTK